MSRMTLHMDIEIQEDPTVLLCTASYGTHSKRCRLRKPDGSEFTSFDCLRIVSDSGYFSELLEAAIDRGDVEEGGAQ